MQGWERQIYTISVQRPQPHNINLLKERIERDNSRRQKMERAALSKKKNIGPALKTRQPHTIEYGVSKIVSQRH